MTCSEIVTKYIYLKDSKTFFRRYENYSLQNNNKNVEMYKKFISSKIYSKILNNNLQIFRLSTRNPYSNYIVLQFTIFETQYYAAFTHYTERKGFGIYNRNWHDRIIMVRSFIIIVITVTMLVIKLYL